MPNNCISSLFFFFGNSLSIPYIQFINILRPCSSYKNQPPLKEMQMFIPRYTESETLDEVWNLHFLSALQVMYVHRNLTFT